nr:hypothetical protein [Tanacetum cinerariifolium]
MEKFRVVIQFEDFFKQMGYRCYDNYLMFFGMRIEVYRWSEEDKMRIRDMNKKAEREKTGSRMKRLSKRQKTNADLEEEEQLRVFLNIILDEEREVDYAVLDK